MTLVRSMGLAEDRKIRIEIDDLLIAVLIVSVAVVVLPVVDTLLTIANQFQGNIFLINPNVLMDAAFLLCLEGVLLYAMIYFGYRQVRGDKQWAAEHESPRDRR